MKISEQWLRAWVNPDLSAVELAEQLTLLGLEVDEVEPVEPTFTKVVVGEILAAAPHENADSLRVCRVSVGGDQDLQIVCGAPNAATGLKAPVAMVGARLAGGMKIRKSKLRGVESQGMLCSAAELELSVEADGLMALPEDAPVGTPLESYLQLNDTILHVELTPDRGDCLSAQGLARDLSAKNDLDITRPDLQEATVSHEQTWPVNVAVDNACVRYAGRVITGVNCAAETPLWMSERLRRSGIRSINPPVDITNYVMMELGQPMHAFDLDKLQGAIQVRRATKGETLMLLDSREVTLDDDTTVIADDRGAIGVAGIMGGLDTAVDESTRNIFFESALFLPEKLAGIAWRLDAHSESSHRFERGVDPAQQVVALEYATQLLLSIAGGSVGPVVDWANESALPLGGTITLRAARIERLLGKSLPPMLVESILQRLGVSLETNAEGWAVTPPSYRYDLRIEEDYIEELARVHGFEQFERRMGEYQPTFSHRSESVLSTQAIEDTLVSRGFQQVISYTFVDADLQAQLEQGAAVALSNPISSDMSVMRTSLVTGLLETLKRNIHRQNHDLKIFEVGLNYAPQDVEIKQKKYLGGLISGRRFAENWVEADASVDFYDLKGHVESLVQLSAGVEWSFVSGTEPFLHPGQSADLLANGEKVGWLGLLHPFLQKSLDVSQKAFMFEVSMAALQNAEVPKLTPVSKYPGVRRDIALMAEESVSFGTIEQCINSAAPDYLQRIIAFDVYQGDRIEKGKKSIALGLILQDFSRTLLDTEVDGAVDKILQSLDSELGVRLRD